MNPETNIHRPVWHIGFVFLIACFLFAGFVVWVRNVNSFPPISADQAVLRAKDLAEIRATETEALDNPGWIDQSRGVVRLPIDTAMKLAAEDWTNPAKARADLIAREEKASAPAPKAPAAPAKANPFD